MPFEQRFWSKVDKSDGCWLWTAALTKFGYGALGGSAYNRRHGFDTALAHRISWVLAFGEIEDGLCVCHRCDVPACVRPEHLFLGTKQDNNLDMVAKKRNRCNPNHGEDNHRAKLTEDAVRKIRELSEDNVTQTELAARFGVTQSTISKITLRHKWTHI